jgi:hypothetical protein
MTQFNLGNPNNKEETIGTILNDCFAWGAFPKPDVAEKLGQFLKKDVNFTIKEAREYYEFFQKTNEIGSGATPTKQLIKNWVRQKRFSESYEYKEGFRTVKPCSKNICDGNGELEAVLIGYNVDRCYYLFICPCAMPKPGMKYFTRDHQKKYKVIRGLKIGKQ